MGNTSFESLFFIVLSKTTKSFTYDCVCNAIFIFIFVVNRVILKYEFLKKPAGATH